MRHPRYSLREEKEIKRAHDTLRLFRSICRHLSLRSEPCLAAMPPIRRVDLKAIQILKFGGEWPLLPPRIVLGAVPGVEVGAEFGYRVELAIVRLHRRMEHGIDYDPASGLASSVVASSGYPNSWSLSDGVLAYSGAGGFRGRKAEPRDQRMEGGNLALKRSVEAKNPVRVIYGVRDLKSKTASAFFYDGLYLVERCSKVIGSNDCSVFLFRLRRMEGQPRSEKLEALLRKKEMKARRGRSDCALGKRFS